MNKPNYDKYESKNTVDLDKDHDHSESKDKQTGLTVIQLDNQEGKQNIQIKNDTRNEANKDSNNNETTNKEDSNVTIPSNYETLDESICETLKRDLLRIYHKLEHVLLPRFSASKGKELQNWDLWGPLLFCVLLCFILSFSSNTQSVEAKGDVFITIFVVVWFGGLIITLNSQFLGAPLNFFQSICLLGYCIFPIDLAALIIRLVSSAKFVKVIIVGLAFLWSCFCKGLFNKASVGFISGIVTEEKKMIAVYPIFLFFGVLSWFVLNM